MPKKCIICDQSAQYVIKDTSDAYCQECAIEFFNDTSLLLSVEEQAQELKKLIKEDIKENVINLSEDENDNVRENMSDDENNN